MIGRFANVVLMGEDRLQCFLLADFSYAEIRYLTREYDMQNVSIQSAHILLECPFKGNENRRALLFKYLPNNCVVLSGNGNTCF